MTKVTKESLAARIAELESAVYRSLKEEFQLEAYRLLAAHLHEVCAHARTLDVFNPNSPTYATIVCVDCGAELGNAE